MSQPQPPPYPYNPYNQPPMAQQPPGPAVPPPFPGQLPMQPGQPYPVHPVHPGPFGQQPNPGSGRPIGAFLLSLLASVLISAVYSATIYATYQDQSEGTVHTLYLLHALVNGAAVGVLTGLVGGPGNAARTAGTIVAALGAFFGYTNAVPLVIADSAGHQVLRDMLASDPFTPAKAWWGSQTGGEWIALLGLVLAAATAWGLAYAIGRSRR